MNSILEMVEETAARCPESPAVTDPSGSRTYGQLIDDARRAGSFLIGQGVKASNPVVITLEKSCGAVTLLYAVLYAGAFYVFVDLRQPPARVRKLLDKIQPSAVIALLRQDPLLAEAGWEGKIFHPEEMLRCSVQVEALKAVRDKSTMTDPLYGIFTSGSSGFPKCVEVSHDAAWRFIGHFTEIFGIRSTDRIGNQAPFDFDVSVKDIYSAAMTGAELVLIPAEYFIMPKLLLDYLAEKRVSVLIWAVSALCLLSERHGFDYRTPETVRLVMFSGEVMPMVQLRRWMQALPRTTFVNLYGPSEITCNCTYYRVENPEAEELPIGRPFPGRTIRLYDKSGRIIHKPMERGEICIGGESVSDGYWRDPEKTAEKFTDINDNGTMLRMYHSGDIGYFDTDGLLHYCGRDDAQIKHMGHRIELGEIETAAMSLPGVIRACCFFDRASNRILCAYTGNLPAASMRQGLKRALPAYMIPQKIVPVESFRLNAHGKLDREAVRKRLEEMV